MAKYIFNPFTKNFSIIPTPPKTGFYYLTVRDGGKMAWVAKVDPLLKTLKVDFSSDIAATVTQLGILPRFGVAKKDGTSTYTITDVGSYSYNILLDPSTAGASVDTSFYTVGFAVPVGVTPVITSDPPATMTIETLAHESAPTVAISTIYLINYTDSASIGFHVPAPTTT
jgi:hypothetical protein